MAQSMQKNKTLSCNKSAAEQGGGQTAPCGIRLINAGCGFESERREELGGIYNSLAAGDSAEVEFYEDRAVYRLHNAGGEGLITAYPAFNGVSVLYDDMHMETFGEGGTREFALTVEHCRQGRFEACLAGGRRIYLGAGDVCVHNMDYADISRSSMPYRHYHGCTVMIKDDSDELFRTFLTGAGIDFDSIVRATRAAGGVRVLRSNGRIDHIFGELYRGEAGRQGFLRLKVTELLLFLSGELKESAVEEHALHPETAELIKGVERYLWSNLGGNLTVPALCARFGISATSLKMHFKTMYGCPLHAYVNTCRMQVAARMLTEGTAKIGEIAYSVGFCNASKFSRAFFKYSGCTPARWRAEKRTADWAFNRP